MGLLGDARAVCAVGRLEQGALCGGKFVERVFHIWRQIPR